MKHVQRRGRWCAGSPLSSCFPDLPGARSCPALSGCAGSATVGDTILSPGPATVSSQPLSDPASGGPWDTLALPESPDWGQGTSPAAEVTVSPRRSHSPGSMNPDQAREHRAWRVAACDRKRVVRLATAFESCRCLSCASRLRVTWLRRSRTFRARCPSLRRAGRLWLRLFWLPHHPLRLPAPPRGWNCRAGPLNPGLTGVALQAQGGS